MAYYDYRCSDCSTTFEISRSMNEAAKPAQCTSCGSDKTQRVFSAPGIGSNAAPAMAQAAAPSCGPSCACALD